MKRRILLLTALALVIGAASFTTSDQTASAQNQLRAIADSGVVTLGPNQVLRVTVATGAGNDEIRVRFRQSKYEICQATPKLCVESQTTSPVITLAPNEAAAVDVVDYISSSWRTVVLSNSRNVKVTSVVFDTSTQRVVSVFTNDTIQRMD
jgi:hypothetical protein